MITRLWGRWVDIWDRREHPLPMALVRILLGAVVFVDLLRMGILGLVNPLMAPAEAGGWGVPLALDHVPWFWASVPPTSGMAVLQWALMLGAALCVLVGLAPRAAAVVFVLLSAQFAITLPAADRGIDTLIRNAMLLLACARCGDTLSLGRRARTGRWTAPLDHQVPAWPRYLMLVQLTVLYFAAGVSKVASSWTPFGGWTALYIAMRDPHFQVLPDDVVDTLFPFTQALTGSSWIWEWMGPTLLLAYHFRATRDRGGWLRATFNRLDYRLVYLGIGALFHAGTHISFRLGIFPFAVMALYPAAFHADELHAAAAWVRRRVPVLRSP